MDTYHVLKQLQHLLKLEMQIDNINPAFKQALIETLVALNNLKKFY